jgi:alpha-glucosidase (family GH31 glycosyl hydrolase)
MFPIAKRTTAYPDSYDYKFWKDIYVSPIVESVNQIKITFPKENDWVDWWNNRVYRGGSIVESYKVPLENFPVFKRVGAIIPLDVVSSYGGHGDESSKGYLTLLIQHPKAKESLEFREYKNHGFNFQYEIKNNKMRMIRTAHYSPMIILIKGENFNQHLNIQGMKKSLTLEAFRSNKMDAFYFSESEIWIKVQDSSKGYIQEIQNIYSPK